MRDWGYWEDHFEELGDLGRDGIERSCTGCSEPVMVTRDEAGLVQVFCEACLTTMAQQTIAALQEH